MFKEYHLKLVQALPMDDPIFISWLFKNDLLPGNSKGEINASTHSSANKATMFLNTVIQPSIEVNNGKMFKDLLKVMKDFGDSTLKSLAETISRALNQISKEDKGGIVFKLP